MTRKTIQEIVDELIALYQISGKPQSFVIHHDKLRAVCDREALRVGLIMKIIPAMADEGYHLLPLDLDDRRFLVISDSAARGKPQYGDVP